MVSSPRGLWRDVFFPPFSWLANVEMVEINGNCTWVNEAIEVKICTFWNFNDNNIHPGRVFTKIYKKPSHPELDNGDVPEGNLRNRRHSQTG